MSPHAKPLADALAKLIEDWLQLPKRKGRPTCPCGFEGGSRNIREHRQACIVWRAYAHNEYNTDYDHHHPSN